MPDEVMHFPGQELPEHKEPQVPAPAPEAPKAEETKTDPAPEAPKLEDEAPKTDPPEESKVTKPRSIYQDLKETRQEKNAWQETAIEALKAQGIELTGDETPEKVRELLSQHKVTPPAPEPAKPEAPAPSKPKDELEAFAQEKGYDPEEMSRLRDLILKDVPKSELSAEERQQLAELTKFKQEADAKEARRKEDEAIAAEAPTVKTTLDIHDDKELAAVMAEVIRLAHTPRYADKEVDYIVFREKEALSKLVSPKKPSFEGGTQTPAPEAEPDVDLSKGGVTPEQVQKLRTSGTKSQLEIRSAL
jgi:hypothetical protein